MAADRAAPAARDHDRIQALPSHRPWPGAADGLRPFRTACYRAILGIQIPAAFNTQRCRDGTMTEVRTIAIVGGGLGGLTAAIALRQRGFDVTVYEQADQLGEIGAGIQLSPNAMRVLIGLGLDQAFEAIAFEPEPPCRAQLEERRRRVGDADEGRVPRAIPGRLFRRAPRRPACRAPAGAADGVRAALGALHRRDADGGRRHPRLREWQHRQRRHRRSAPTASAPPCAKACTGRTRRASPDISSGAGWCRRTRCRRV